MPDAPEAAGEFTPLMGQVVIVDVKGRYIYIGTLRRVGAQALLLGDADVHFCDDSHSTSEYYLVETKKNGVRPNRTSVYVMRSEVLSISRLEDVVDY
jgi:hypothetical protein